MKNFKGKAIYNPSGKAGEYSYWACNFYVGCSNSCEYCYCKKGILAGAMGMDTPQLKKCFNNETHAIKVFSSELQTNLIELQKHGLFFSFTTDPMLDKTQQLTINAIYNCVISNVPVKILTKCTDWLEPFLQMIEDDIFMYNKKNLIAFGFTLTGHDELEKGAATNEDRIRAMKVLSAEGFKTFASIEPIIDFDSATRMIELSMEYCDLYKIGLMSGSKPNIEDLRSFVGQINWYSSVSPFNVYWKDSISKYFTTNAWLDGRIVNRDFNLHDAN